MKTKINNTYKKKQLDSNIVEDYFLNNPDKKLSAKTLKKRLNISIKDALFFANNSDYIKCVDPLEVGSDKNTINVFTYTLSNIDTGLEEKKNEDDNIIDL